MVIYHAEIISVCLGNIMNKHMPINNSNLYKLFLEEHKIPKLNFKKCYISPISVKVLFIVRNYIPPENL
jgi:hypothetical protein